MHICVFLIQSASFIHLVCRCASLSTTFPLPQSMTWFSFTAWSVMADLWVTLLSLALEARVCVPAMKESTSFLCSLILRPNFLPVSPTYELTLRNFVVHPKDKVKDEEKTELIDRVPCKNCSSSYVGEIGRKFGLRIKKQCNSQVSHHRPCRGREPCHRLGQGKSGRQRGTVTYQMDKRNTLDQEDTEVYESGCMILPTQPHMGPGDFQVTCSIEL